MDYGDVGVTVKLSKWKWSNAIGNRKKAVTKTVNSRHDYLKPLLKKNSDIIILHIGTSHSVNETSQDILNGILSLKIFIEKLRT